MFFLCVSYFSTLAVFSSLSKPMQPSLIGIFVEVVHEGVSVGHLHTVQQIYLSIIKYCGVLGCV